MNLTNELHDDAPDTQLCSLIEEQSRLNRRLRPVSFAFNALLVIVFLWLHVWPLAASYAAGALFFEWRYRKATQSDYRPTRMAIWIWLVTFVQPVLAVVLVGPDAGFQFYLITVLLRGFSSVHRSLPHKLLQGTVVVVFFILCDTWLSAGQAVYALPAETITWLRHLNIVGVSAILGWTAHSHALAVKEAGDTLRQIASSDPLTGLHNRRSITEIAQREFARSARKRHPLSVILCDIDHFKHVNDTWGHAAGDHVLECIAGLLQGMLRDYDHLSRWGGEEFLVLLPDTDARTALQIGQRLRGAVESHLVMFEGLKIPLTMTFGVAEFHIGENWHATVNRADEALYRGKQDGRNCVIAA